MPKLCIAAALSRARIAVSQFALSGRLRGLLAFAQA